MSNQIFTLNLLYTLRRLISTIRSYRLKGIDRPRFALIKRTPEKKYDRINKVNINAMYI